MMETFNLYKRIAIKNPYSNIDALYGPYNSLEEARKAVPQNLRAIGLTVGVLNTASGIIEYQWKKGTKDEDLKEKNSASLELTLVSDKTLNVEKNTLITIRLEGDAIPSSIEVFSKTNIEDAYQITNYRYPGQIVKNSDVLIDLQMDVNPAPRTVYYAIRVIDNLGNPAKTNNGEDMVEFVLNYKEVQTNIAGTSSIYGVKVKSLNNLMDKGFTFSVSKIASVEIQKINILIGDYIFEEFDEDTSSYSVTFERSKMEDKYKGKDVKIQINYTSNGVQKIPKEDVVLTILGANVFSNPQLESPSSVFQNTNFDIKLYYEAEEELNYNIAISNYGPQLNPAQHLLFQSSYQAYKTNVITLQANLTGRTQETQVFYIYVNNNFDKELTSFLTIVYPYSLDTFIPVEEGGSNAMFVYYNNINDVLKKMKSDSTITSFILDLECFIPYKSDPETILFNLFNITIRREYITFGQIYYPTPIQEQVSLGFAFLVREGSYVYNALFINGKLCYKVPVTQVTSDNVITGLTTTSIGTPTNDVTIYRFNFYYNFNNVLPAIESYSYTDSIDYDSPHILAKNYLSLHSDTNTELPTFHLEAIPSTDEELGHLYEDRGIVPGRFGNIGDEKYNDTSANIAVIASDIPHYNVLMRQTTELKKTLLKKVGVICKWTFGEESGLVEVHTQGTSTLDFALPNFKFTFLDNSGKKLKTKLVPNPLGGYFEESDLTGKADYMDSSHLNNTPTAMYYNKIVQTPVFYSNEEGNSYDYRSPSAKNGGLDAISGFPIILEIQDITEDGKSGSTKNYGSFMLNIDKTGDALKFKIDGQDDTCISFEGTSNEDNAGLSSRFIITDSLKSAFNNIHSLLEEETPELNWYYNSMDNGDYKITYTKNYTVIDLIQIVTQQYSQDSVLNTNYSDVIKVLDYLSEGLEYRYPDGDIISQKDSNNDGYYTLMPFNHFKRLFKMFYWVANSSNLSDEDYRTQFKQIFSFEYCALYFIQLMIFGQTDNLGKNCMFDLWTENGLWYPRPYDLDSQVGLNNDGKDIIPPFVEIRPNFSLNYAQVQSDGETIFNTAQKGELPSTNKYYQVFLDNKNITLSEFLANYVFPDNHLVSGTQLPYENTTAARYGYSSPTSNLWINFYLRFKDLISLFYADLRKVKVNSNLLVDETASNNTVTLYSPETIVNFCKSEVIDKLGILQYNLDFRYKYLTNVDHTTQFAFGDRYFKYKSWMTKRFSFCDVYFNYERYLTNVRNGSILMRFNFPLYFIYKYSQDNARTIVLFYDGTNPINYSVEGAAVNNDMYFSPKNIISGEIYQLYNSCSPKIELNNLLSLSAQLSFFNVASIANNTYMTRLSLNGITSAFSERIIPVNIKHLTITNSSIIPDLNNLLELEDLTIENCNNLILNIINCPQLSVLSINKCTNLNLTIQSLLNISKFDISQSTFSKLDINGCSFDTLNLQGLILNNLSFSGDISNINIVDLRNSRVNTRVNIEKLNANSLMLNSSTVPGIICDTPKNFVHLSLTNSSIAYWRTSTASEENVFDGSLFANLNDVLSPTLGAKLPTATTSNSLNSGATRFNLNGCQNIEIVKNLTLVKGTTLNNSTNSLFKTCKKLKRVENCKIEWSGYEMFYQCINLEQINDCTIKVVDKNASYMFTLCNKLPYSYIKKILEIEENKSITDFSYFMLGKTFESDTTINLEDYPSATNLSNAFSIRNWISGVDTSTRNTTIPYTLTIKGSLPNGITAANGTFTNDDANYGKYLFEDWSNLLKGCKLLTSTIRMFWGVDFELTNTHNDNNYLLTSEFFIVSKEPPISSKIENVQSMFANTKNLTIDPEFKFPESVTDAICTFYGSKLKDNVKRDVGSFFIYCTDIAELMYCFHNCNWIELNSTFSVGNITGSYNVFGIFSGCNTTLKYGFNGKWKSEYNERVVGTGGTRIDYSSTEGVYKGNTVVIESNEISIAATRATKLFDEATLQLDFTTTKPAKTLTINIASPTDIRRFMYKTTIAEDSLPCYVDVTFGNNISTAISAFEECKVLNLSKNPILPASLTDASRMFYNSSLNLCPDLHATKLTDASYMFYNCLNLLTLYNPKQWSDIQSYNNIDEIAENDVNMLFVLPDTLTNVAGMFLGCINLQGGIPTNFIKSTNKLISLEFMFDSTSILVIYDANQLPYPYSLNISLMFPLVTNVTGMFRYNWVNTSVTIYWLPINKSCFANCTNIRLLFEHNYVNPSIISSLPGELELLKINNAAYAFYNTNPPDSMKITLSLDALVTNVEGMFATGRESTPEMSENKKNNQVMAVYNNISTVIRDSATQFKGYIQGYKKLEKDLTDDVYYQTLTNATTLKNQGHVYTNPNN